MSESQSRRYVYLGLAVVLGVLAVWCFTRIPEGFDGKLEGTPPWLAGAFTGFFAVAALSLFVKESRATAK